MQALLAKILGVVLVVVLLAGLSVGLYDTRKTLTLTRTQLDEQKVAVVALRASQLKMQSSITAVQRVQAETSRTIRASLDKEPAFRDTPVPRSVADGLCGRLRCVP